MKEKVLGVKRSILSEHGAVSGECAESMARRTAELYETSLAVAVTGIAGPGGGNEEKPIGTVWFAVASRIGGRTESHAFVRHLSGGRGLVRERAARVALTAVWRRMCEL
jgi:PncC family amidohydrolase